MNLLYKAFFTLLVLFGFSFNSSLNATYIDRQQSDPLELGVSLETEFWTLVQEHNVKRFSKKLAPIFQGLNISGSYTREQQISGLAGATLTGFAINNPVVTRSGNTLVITYNFVATDSNLTNGPSITIWKKYGCSWKIVSHSYVPFLQ